MVHSMLRLSIYLLLKYQVKANWLVVSPNGVGTSAKPGLATGCLRYTAAQIFWLTSKYLGMKAKADMYGRGRQGVAYGFVGSIGLSRASFKASRSASLSSSEIDSVGGSSDEESGEVLGLASADLDDLET